MGDPMKKKPVDRLAQALAYWEHSMLFMDASQVALERNGMTFPHFPPFENWGRLRGEVLRAQDKPFPVDLFEHSESVFQKSVGGVCVFPSAFYAWNKHSRRVFHVTSSLQALLAVTDVSRMALPEVAWPFDAFLITLENPWISSAGGEYDAILFTRLGEMVGESEEENTAIRLIFLPRWLAEVTPITRGDRAEVTKHLRDKKVSYRVLMAFLEKVAVRCGHGLPAASTSPVLAIDLLEGGRRKRTYVSAQEAVPAVQVTESDLSSALRLLVGLALYLTTAGESGPRTERGDGNMHIGGNDPRAIRFEAEVAHVYAGRPPSDEEVEIFLAHRSGRGGVGEASATFVIGHWKRPRGQGANPHAAKTVWVRPHLRRKDLLKPGELPGGLHQER